MSESFDISGTFEGLPEHLHEYVKQNIFSTPFRDARIKNYDDFFGRILSERQPLVKQSWHMAEFFWLFIQENAKIDSDKIIDIGLLLNSRDEAEIQNIDRSILLSSVQRVFLFSVFDSFCSSVIQIERGQITGARGLLRFCAEATSRLALITNSPERLTDAILKDEFLLDKLPKEREYERLHALRGDLSESAAHASIGACVFGMHKLQDIALDKISFFNIENAYHDIFITFERVRDVLFKLFGREQSQRICELHRAILLLNNAIKSEFNYFNFK